MEIVTTPSGPALSAIEWSVVRWLRSGQLLKVSHGVSFVDGLRVPAHEISNTIGLRYDLLQPHMNIYPCLGIRIVSDRLSEAFWVILLYQIIYHFRENAVAPNTPSRTDGVRHTLGTFAKAFVAPCTAIRRRLTAITILGTAFSLVVSDAAETLRSTASAVSGDLDGRRW